MSVPTSRTCRDPKGDRLHLSSSSGTIASLLARHTLCPWRVEVLPYQRIHLTLVDFSVPRGADPWFSRAQLQAVSAQATHCRPYAVVVEGTRNGSVGANVSICGTARRETSVYTSTGNVIDIHVTSSLPDKYFLLKYEGASSELFIQL